MIWLWGLVAMLWSQASPTHSQLSNSCEVSGWRIWQGLFQTLGAWENVCNMQAKGKLLQCSTGHSGSLWSVIVSAKWKQGWPGFALNMSAIRDKLPAHLGKKSETEWAQEPSVSWHVSCCAIAPTLTSVSPVQHRPLNEFSLQFQLRPVLAHRHCRTKRQCQATEHRAALNYSQSDSDMTGLKFTFNKCTHTHPHWFIFIMAIIHAACRYMRRQNKTGLKHRKYR